MPDSRSHERRPLILRTDGELQMGGSVLAEINKLADIVTANDDATPQQLQQVVADADLIFTCYAPITAEVIAAGKRLRGIVKYGVGVDSIDLEAAAERGIPVVHCPDYGTETVADQAFALLIGLARKIPLVDREFKKQGWLWPEPKYLGVDLADKTIGIVGFGRIGKAMARRAAGFGMRRLVCDPYVDASNPETGGLEFTSLDKVIAQADFLSLHCVLTDETRGLIGQSELRQMKDTSLLINVSRGPLVDEQALVSALQEGRIAGAGLDVFHDEPLPDNHPLLAMDNVAVSPHFAFYTREAYDRLEQECLDKIRDLLAGRLPSDVKNADLLKKIDTTAVMQAGEGDVNLSNSRNDWQDKQLSDQAKAMLDEDAHWFLHQSLSTPCLNALAGSEGIYLVDVQGRRIMDFHGNSAHQVGYGHPHVVESIKLALDQMPFCPRRYTNRPAIDLAKQLAELAPGNLNKVLFAPGGASAIGIAMKLARYATGRFKTISMWDTFHGASLDAISIGGDPLFRDGLGPLLPGCLHVEWPQGPADADAIETLLIEHGDIGAVIAEPMRCTTMKHPTARYWQRVRQLCDRHGTMLIFDEIPVALGRTGRMFCCEHFDVVPDMLVIGKGLGGGIFPMAAVLIREDLDRYSDRAIGHYTHEKSSVGSAAALATIEVIHRENLLEHSRLVGEYFYNQMCNMQQRQPLISEVRGLGLALAIEITENDIDNIAEQIMYACLTRGLSFKVSAGNILTLTPPLVITEKQLDEAIEILEQSIAEVAGTCQA
ncbi:MAG: aspartate aminotransferase family protein [Planctomycetales bacterium]